MDSATQEIEKRFKHHKVNNDHAFRMIGIRNKAKELAL